jgi:hypothetical protein
MKKYFCGNPVFGGSAHPVVNMFLFCHHKAMIIFGKDNSFSENRQNVTGYGMQFKMSHPQPAP